MPGSVGGGNSGSFSGGSAGVSSGGMTGGFSGGSTGGPTGGAMPPPVFGHVNGGGSNRHGRGRNGRGSGGILRLIIIAAVVGNIFFIQAGIFSDVAGDIFHEIKNIFSDTTEVPVPIHSEEYREEESVEVYRERLAESGCSPISYNIVDSDGILSEDDANAVSTRLDLLYELTGVQTVMIFRHEINNAYDPSYGDVEEFLTNTYNDLFDDEGHVIILIVTDDDGNYTTWYICGNDTAFSFGETDAFELLDYIDGFAQEGYGLTGSVLSALDASIKRISDEFAFVNAQTDPSETVSDNTDKTNGETNTAGGETAAESEKTEQNKTERVTEKNVSEPDTEPVSGANGSPFVTKTALITYFVSLLAVVIAAFVIFKLVRRHAESKKDENYEAHRETADHTHLNDNPYYNDKSSLPVRCPHCGALGALTVDGRCRYCGEKLK